MYRTKLPLLSLIVIVCGLVLLSCSSQTAPPASPPPSGASVTPTPAPNTAQITSKKTGKTFSYVRVAESDDSSEKIEPPQPGVETANPDNFRGTDRKAAKISISTGPTHTFADLAALFSSGLFLPDSQMTNHHPPISKDATSDRVKEEKHNVVVTAYLYASSKESDNDFHCIFGTAPGQPAQFLNVEVSGLPVSGPAKAQLKTVRDKFKEFFGQDLPGPGYSKFEPPIPVKITGSIFFDIDHPAGAVGPTGFKPTTAWEIHPVSDIEFEP